MHRTCHQGDLRKGRFSQKYGLYLVTKCVAHGHSLTAAQRCDVAQAMHYVRGSGFTLLHAFVVMPDHWHALISLTEACTLDQVVWKICRRARYRWRDAVCGGYSWQEGYHDHKVREGESVVSVVRYVEANPVRKGLCEVADEWDHSSAHREHKAQLDRSFLGHERWA